MKKIQSIHQTSRSACVFVLVTFFYLLILVRLIYIQVVDHAFYALFADRQYYGSVTQHPPRAPIFDRYGNYLAMNKESFSAFILPQQVHDWDALLLFVQTLFPESYERIKTHKDKKFLYLKRRLTPRDIAAIKEVQNSDIHLLQEPGRFYPVLAAGVIVGITDIDNKGIMGVELWGNQYVAGIPTTYELEKDARSDYFYFNKVKISDGVDGVPITLTIDRDLQFLLHEELEACRATFQAKEGSVIVINPENGDILAMVCVPCFDPNQTGFDTAHTKARPITESYELGSVIKICAALAALEENKVTLDELIDCKNTKSTYIDGRPINTWKEDGLIPFCQVVAQSNNIGTAIVAKRLGVSLYDHYKRMGFGVKTGIEFPGEAVGFLNPPHNWSKQSIISLCYGYEVSATLLQLAAVFCMIARDGYAVKPRLILSPEQDFLVPKKLYSDHAVRAVKKILEETTMHGTGKKAGIKGYQIMSKTGTANMVVKGRYDTQKNIYTCAGIVQKDAYQRVIVTFIKEANRSDIYASTVAAPLFERVAECLLIHDRVLR